MIIRGIAKTENKRKQEEFKKKERNFKKKKKTQNF